ncbi:MAG: hypothetical protein KBA95_02690 [Acidobacteria bacterium]|nr:hypothetical protein [Acidobacteriota bacterium]
MHKKRVVWFLAPVVVAAAVVACSDNDKPNNPVNPTPVGDTTLKAGAPTLVSPNNVEADSRTPTLVLNNATATFASVPLAYRFQVQDAGGAVFEEKLVNAGSGGRTTYTITKSLAIDRAYTWTARAEYQDGNGPWATKVSFRSPKIPEGYIRGNELYDPLNGGKALGSVGKIVGAHTWIPGVGLRLDDDRSYIEYLLPNYCGQGEFSVIVTGICGSCGTVKSKVMSMREGRSDLVPNPHRMTVEKRSDGNVAWRFITSSDQVDTVGAERTDPGIRAAQVNLWKATWDGVFRVTISRMEGKSFHTFYNMGKSYHGVYNPKPHYAYVGSPMGGSHGTVPGMIVRQVWLGPRPRPDFANE